MPIGLLVVFAALLGSYATWTAQAAVSPVSVSADAVVPILSLDDTGNDAMFIPYRSGIGLHAMSFVCELTEREEEDENEKTLSFRKYVRAIILHVFSEAFLDGTHNRGSCLNMVDGHLSSALVRGLYVIFEVFRI